MSQKTDNGWMEWGDYGFKLSQWIGNWNALTHHWFVFDLVIQRMFLF